MAAAAAERSSSTRFHNIKTTQVRIPNVLSFYPPVAKAKKYCRFDINPQVRF